MADASAMTPAEEPAGSQPSSGHGHGDSTNGSAPMANGDASDHGSSGVPSPYPYHNFAWDDSCVHHGGASSFSRRTLLAFAASTRTLRAIHGEWFAAPVTAHACRPSRHTCAGLAWMRAASVMDAGPCPPSQAEVASGF
jgi:hypothetical protein